MSGEPKYKREEINNLLQSLLAEVGPEEFGRVGVVRLEELLRQRNSTHSLPGRTILRECIHQFRHERWPEAAPRRRF